MIKELTKKKKALSRLGKGVNFFTNIQGRGKAVKPFLKGGERGIKLFQGRGKGVNSFQGREKGIKIFTREAKGG